ncbi:MAG: hypothetical protein ABI540_10565 [Spartobacteria bacterium]
MAFKKYTQCYSYLETGVKPFHIDDLVATVAGAAGVGAVGAIISWALGIWVLGGIFFTIGFVNAIITVANLWLYHRLACLTGVKCAVGMVHQKPDDGGLGNFDNDQFFNVILMPHRLEDTNGADGNTTPELDAHPENYVHRDGLMGEELLTSIPESGDLPYDFSKEESTTLHCEAEGAFWVKMKEWAVVMGIILGTTTTLGVAGGAAAGAAIGCAFGPIICLLAIIIGAIIGGLIGGAVGGAIDAGIMAIIFEASMGDVEEANVGDADLGPIREGDRVIVLGEHVYDGFHEGWNEFHPLMAVMKLNQTNQFSYLLWDPAFPDGGAAPGDTDDMPADIRNLFAQDIQEGLSSTKFAKRAHWLRRKYCGMLRDAFEPRTRDEQKKARHRWTIHPAVDGCREEEEIIH